MLEKGRRDSKVISDGLRHCKGRSVMVKYKQILEEEGRSEMDKEVLKYVVEKTQELIDSQTCSSETRLAAQAWLAAVGTEMEAAETVKYIEELEADIMPIDGLIGFAESDAGAHVFGADKAKDVAAHAKEIKSAGARYCDCPACAAVEAILEKKESILK